MVTEKLVHCVIQRLWLEVVSLEGEVLGHVARSLVLVEEKLGLVVRQS